MTTLPRRWGAAIAIWTAPFLLVPLLMAYAMGTSGTSEVLIPFAVGFLFAVLGTLFIMLRQYELEPMTSPIICPKCSSALPASNYDFCPRCGAELTKTSENIALPAEPAPEVKHNRRTPRKRTREAVCMVCDLTIEPNDKLAWCPHCGNVAHKDHLTQWVRTKKRCPMCGHPLDQTSLAEKAPRHGS